MPHKAQVGARVVAVHGIGQQRSGSNLLNKDWWPSINDGLDGAGHRRLVSDELKVAFYEVVEPIETYSRMPAS